MGCTSFPAAQVPSQPLADFVLPLWLLEKTAAVLGPRVGSLQGKNDYPKTRIPKRKGEYDSNLLDQLREETPSSPGTCPTVHPPGGF